MEGIKECELVGYPKPISFDCTKTILEQMEKYICKIEIGNKRGTGFFAKIPFPKKDKTLKVFITNNHIVDEKLLNDKNKHILIKIKDDNDYKKINLNNKKKYTNKEYDITIIELKDEDEIDNYLELDDNIINDILKNDNNNIDYKDKTIYIIQYPDGELSVSYGILNNISEDKKYNFKHKCDTRPGSSGAPIMSLNNKIIGIHKEGNPKYNVGSFLNYPIKEFIQQYSDFTDEKLLKVFNKKYNVNIVNNNIKEIDLRIIDIGNIGLEELCEIEMKELKKLVLESNKITEITALENAKFEKLEILNLNNNNITDIKTLSKVNFKKLKTLILQSNNISDINILSKVNFRELKELYLQSNKISDIKVFEHTKFENLEILNLDNNIITDINVLEKVNYKNLTKLILQTNKITDIKVLEKVNFKELKELYLGANGISDIRVLEKVEFEKLEILNLNNNNITDITVLSKVNFKELKELNLGFNKISDINAFAKANFLELKKLYLSGNKITDIKILDKINFNNLETLLLLYSNKIDENKNSSIISKLKTKIKNFI